MPTQVASIPTRSLYGERGGGKPNITRAEAGGMRGAFEVGCFAGAA